MRSNCSSELFLTSSLHNDLTNVGKSRNGCTRSKKDADVLISQNLLVPKKNVTGNGHLSLTDTHRTCRNPEDLFTPRQLYPGLVGVDREMFDEIYERTYPIIMRVRTQRLCAGDLTWRCRLALVCFPNTLFLSLF